MIMSRFGCQFLQSPTPHRKRETMSTNQPPTPPKGGIGLQGYVLNHAGPSMDLHKDGGWYYYRDVQATIDRLTADLEAAQPYAPGGDKHAEARQERMRMDGEMDELRAELQDATSLLSGANRSVIALNEANDRLRAEIDKLEAALRCRDAQLVKFPRSEDGVPLAAFEEVWVPTGGTYANGEPAVANLKTFVLYRNGRWEFDEDATPHEGPVYSTFEAAAEAALTAEEGGERGE